MALYPELLGKTGDELRQMAHDSRRRSQESFDRCDTDGCVSQWASDLTARLYDHAAALADDGWMAEAPALFSLDGTLLAARQVETRYGTSWVYDDADGAACWVSISTARSPKRAQAHYAKQGVTLGSIRQRVLPAMHGSGRGLSGSAWPGHVADRDFAGQVEVASLDTLAEEIAAGVTDRYDYSEYYNGVNA